MIPLLIALALVIGLPLLLAEIARRLGYFDRSTVITFVVGLESIAWGVHALIARPGWLQAYFVVMGVWFIYMARWRWQASRPASPAPSDIRPPSA